MSNVENNMICDLETGICGTAGDSEMEVIDLNAPTKKATLYYVTDPICSHCWALEPVLRRFEKQYGQYFTVKTVMGGLLEKWEGFADVKNGISSPEDVASHWREVGEHSRMPIDGSVWLKDPVHSSYPPSRVYKVIQQENERLANVFLRRAREALFVYNRNISDHHVLVDIVNDLGLEGENIVKKANHPTGQTLLNEDFSLAKSLGATGFPSIILVNEENKGVKIVGARAFENYVQGLQHVLDSTSLKAQYKPSLVDLLQEEKRLFSREIEEFFEVDQADVILFIEQELSPEQYVTKKILGEMYIETK